MLEKVAVILLASAGLGYMVRIAPASKGISTWKIVALSVAFFAVWAAIILPTLK